MRHLRHWLAIAVLMATPAAMAGQRPAQVVADFYRLAIHPDRPEPLKGRFEAVAPLLGDDLQRALVAYDAYETACSRIVPPDIKPYMLDQSPFFLAPDGAKAVVGTSERLYGAVARVSVTLAYDDVRWTDTVLLGKEQGRWVILDIQWEEGRSLTERLVDFASHRCTS